MITKTARIITIVACEDTLFQKWAAKKTFLTLQPDGFLRVLYT
jgi:hypothetical protein